VTWENNVIRFLTILYISILCGSVFAVESPHKGEFYDKLKSEVVFFDIYDPHERFNRKIYNFNIKADEKVVQPITHAYEYVTPNIMQKGIHNFFRNIQQIPVLANSILQLKGRKVYGTSKRFLLNLTVGCLGFWDPATTKFDMIEYTEDFGQTLGYYGVPKGPYLVIPILGPSNFRDAFGTVVDSVGMAFLYPEHTPQVVPVGVSALQLVDTRSHVTIMYGEFDSIFEYDEMRALYTHARDLLVTDGKEYNLKDDK
jgi:phospholipid-binding lipoprotein MlaA